MIPQPKGRTKRKWLGKEPSKAVIKFNAFVAELKGEDEKVSTVRIVPDSVQESYRVKEGRVKVSELMKHPEKYTLSPELIAKVKEQEHIEWLLKELKDPSALAKKTGLKEFNNFWDYVRTDPIKLSTLIDNFFTMRKKARMFCWYSGPVVCVRDPKPVF
jgi:hypothetical protein